jgi:hypothetical protein
VERARDERGSQAVWTWVIAALVLALVGLIVLFFALIHGHPASGAGAVSFHARGWGGAIALLTGRAGPASR